MCGCSRIGSGALGVGEPAAGCAEENQPPGDDRRGRERDDQLLVQADRAQHSVYTPVECHLRSL
jgi:hypothetical protein